ncbi:MAG: tetratricopeptide repeat protein [Candidatus Rokubacteria bacterium]|nr:tetratricopeptide repeat protein [Candidatus Rokubacteria bacterium]
MKPILLAVVLVIVAWLPPAWAAPIDSLPPPSEGQRLPPALAEAIAALRQGNNEKAATQARAFLKEQPRSAVGHEILAAAVWGLRRLDEAESALQAALSIDPRRVSSLILLGQLRLERGDGAKAEGFFRQAVQVAPDLEGARTSLAEALIKQGRVGPAIAELQEALRVTRGGHVNSKFLLGNLLYELGRTGDAEKLLSELLPNDSGPVQVALLQGLVKLELRKYEESERLLKRVIAQDPRSEWARLGWAMVQASQGQLAPARVEMEKLVKEKPAWSLAHFQLGRILLRQQQAAAAMQSFERAEQTSADAAVIRVRAGQALLEASDIDGALRKAKASVGSPTAGSLARLLIVEAHARRGKREQAEPDLIAAVAAVPAADPSGLLDLGGFYLSIGRPKDAAASFERAQRLRPEAAEPLAGLATAYALLQRRPEAVAAAERLVKIQGDSPEALVFLGTVYERLGDVAEATKVYRRVLGKERNQLTASRALAAVYVREKRVTEAVRLLEDAARAHPTAAAPLTDLAGIHLTAGRSGEAIAAYRRALERDGNDPTLMNNLAYLLSRDSGSLEEAAKLAERALRYVPGHAAFADTAGWVMYLRGDLARAERTLSEAAQVDPRNPEIRYHLGLVYAKLNKKAEARRELEQAVQAPGFPGAADARKALEALR